MLSTHTASTANKEPPANFQAELLIQLTPSRYLLGFIVVTHSLAALIVGWMPLAVFWKLGLISVIAATGGYALLLHSGRLPQRGLRWLKWREFGGWEVMTLAGEHLGVVLQDHSFSSYYLNVLHLTSRQGQRFVVILLADNCPPAQAQLLRRRLHLLPKK